VLAATEEHALSQRALDLAHPFGIPITNSMVVTWIVALALIAVAQIATRNMREVPSGAQNLLVERTFWFFATIFIFILAANWIGLIPGVGSLGWSHRAGGRFIVDEPLFRGANADVNMTLAMALVFFVCWVVWSLQEIGARGLVRELFGPKGESTGALKVLLVGVFFAAGCLELISILLRPISLSFRLYGNIFAGETMVGLVQALVFTLLAVFTLLTCQHEKREESHG